MKLIIENLPGETVEIPAGTGGVWKGTTAEGFRCLLVVQQIVRPEGSPDEDFAELNLREENLREATGDAVISQSEMERLVLVAWPDGGTIEPLPPR